MPYFQAGESGNCDACGEQDNFHFAAWASGPPTVTCNACGAEVTAVVPPDCMPTNYWVTLRSYIMRDEKVVYVVAQSEKLASHMAVHQQYQGPFTWEAISVSQAKPSL